MPLQPSVASRHRRDAFRHFSAESPLLPAILAGHERWRARQTALVCGQARLTWAELGAASNRVAHALLGLGLGPKDAVAVAMENRVETVVVLLGLLKSGCCAVPLNLSIPTAAMAGMIDDAGAQAVIASEAEAERIEALLPAAWVHRIVVGRREGWLHYEDWLSGRSGTAPETAIDDDAPCHIIYSSGTTGSPKGIVHCHRGRFDWACYLALALRYHGGARTLATLPLYSNISWVMLLCTFVPGGTLVLTSRFDPASALALLQRERITHLAMVPVQFQRLLDHPGFAETDTGSMQTMMSCGSALGATLKRRVFEGFGCGVIELYGLTEGVITTLDPEVAAEHMASVGRPLPGTEIEIIDELGRVEPVGEVGEIVARGRILMPGYHALPAANAAATWRDPRGRAWLRTGDLGRIDAEGFLTIVGRSKDMIVSGGQNVYPSDIEAVVQQHPDVVASAVIGVPSRDWGESPLAVVEPELTPAQCAQVLRWVNAKVGRFQRLVALESVAALPRNPNGKILKRELEERFGGSGHD